MTAALPAQSYFAKAERALRGAQVLLAAEEPEGACNRAYYAMFDAARAALLSVDVDTAQTSFKTHRSLIAAFGKQIVVAGLMEASYGSAFNQVERIRLLADYTGDPVSLEQAAWSVAQAGAFVAAVRARFFQLSR